MLPVRKYISYLSVSVTSKIEYAHCVALDYVKVVFNKPVLILPFVLKNRAQIFQDAKRPFKIIQ